MKFKNVINNVLILYITYKFHPFLSMDMIHILGLVKAPREALLVFQCYLNILRKDCTHKDDYLNGNEESLF